MCRAHIALQELQAIAKMLYRMAAHLSGKVVALHLDNSTAKAYLCNQDGRVSSFLSRLACQIQSLTDMHIITLIPAYNPTHFNVGADYLSHNWMLPEWHLLPQVAQLAFQLLGLPEVDLLASSCTTQCQYYYNLESPLPLGALGLNAFNHPWMFQVSYVFSPSSISSFKSAKVSGRTCQRSTQTFDSGGTMLDGSSLAPHSSQHVGRCSSMVPHHKRSHCACFSRPGAQGSAISAFNHLAVQ